MAYSIGTNMPGYLPDSEPYYVHTYQEAQHCLLAEIDYDLEMTNHGNFSAMGELWEVRKDLLAQRDQFDSFLGYANNRAYWIEPISADDWSRYCGF